MPMITVNQGLSGRVKETRMYIQTRSAIMGAAAVILLLGTGPTLPAPAAADTNIQSVLDRAYAKVVKTKGGKNADYIPALAKVDPRIFGVVLVTVDGHVYTTGDVKSEVSIQSISKVFTLALVLDQQGPAAVEKNIGVDATGAAFNSITAIKLNKGSEKIGRAHV